MFRLLASVACTLACALSAAPLSANDQHGRTCAAKAKGLYGFQCHGNTFNGVEFDQVTLDRHG